MKQQFNNGDQVYLENGDVAVYIASSCGTHIVRRVYGEGPDEQLGDADEVATVFSSPPIPKFEQRIKELDIQIAAKSSELSELRKKLDDSNKESKEILARLKKLDQLKLVDDFVDGKITHYVVANDWGDYVSIVELRKAVCDSDSDRSYKKRLKLLVLFGDQENRTLKWMLNRYSDGSGSAEVVYPCTSLEMAQEKAKEEFNKKAEKCKKESRWSDCFFKCAAEYGFEVPAEAIQWRNDVKKKYLQATIEKASNELNHAMLELESVS